MSTFKHIANKPFIIELIKTNTFARIDLYIMYNAVNKLSISYCVLKELHTILYKTYFLNTFIIHYNNACGDNFFIEIIIKLCNLIWIVIHRISLGI